MLKHSDIMTFAETLTLDFSVDGQYYGDGERYQNTLANVGLVTFEDPSQAITFLRLMLEEGYYTGYGGFIALSLDKCCHTLLQDYASSHDATSHDYTVRLGLISTGDQHVLSGCVLCGLAAAWMVYSGLIDPSNVMPRYVLMATDELTDAHTYEYVLSHLSHTYPILRHLIANSPLIVPRSYGDLEDDGDDYQSDDSGSSSGIQF